MPEHNELKAKTILLQKRALLATIEESEKQKEHLETHLMNLKLTVEAFDDALAQIPLQLDLFEKELEDAEQQQDELNSLAEQAAAMAGPPSAQ